MSKKKKTVRKQARPASAPAGKPAAANPQTAPVKAPSTAENPAPQAPQSGQTPQAPQKARSPRAMIWASLVMVAAVLIVIAILMRNQNMSGELDHLREDLTESQSTWQQIAAEKEELQDELAVVEDGIREASLSYDESTEKIADLTGQVENLTMQNTSLENQLQVSAETQSVYIRQTEDLAGTLRMLHDADTALSDELASDREYTGSLWAAVINARNTLLTALKDEMKALQEDLALTEARLAALAETGMEEQADAIRGEIQELTSDITALRSQILMYGTLDDLAE